MDSLASTAIGGEQWHDGCSPTSVWQWLKEEEVVVYGKDTMVRLQISVQASKQLCQSGSRNTASVYHRLPNKTTKGIIASHGAT
jgi:hypothetical protein